MNFTEEKIIRENVHEILSKLYAKKRAKKITNGQAIVILETALDEVKNQADLSETVEHNMDICNFLDSMIEYDKKENINA